MIQCKPLLGDRFASGSSLSTEAFFSSLLVRRGQAA